MAIWTWLVMCSAWIAAGVSIAASWSAYRSMEAVGRALHRQRQFLRVGPGEDDRD